MKGLTAKCPRSSIKLNVNSFRRKSTNSADSLRAYSPNHFEENYYKLWNETGCFQPKRSNRIFSVLLPPPNVTGTLHLGHALTVTSIDALARWRRMCGDEVVWVPGMDHAGIATQAVVEKHLEKQGISKSSLGREKFLEEIWSWKDSKGSTILSQLKTLGSSLDWTREFFTMDNMQSKAVVEALLILWNKGLIYRDEKLVNWSPHLRSTVSDIEVNYVEVNGPTSFHLPGYSKPIQFGSITDFAYKVVGSEEEIVVSTTRVETMLGDVAVAVNPNDERYRHLWGSVLHHPFTGAEIPLVLDYSVDSKFGSGALKITPAHDQTDFQIAKSHNLPMLTVINEDGIMVNCGSFSGLKRFDAREAVMSALGEKGLLRETRPHNMKIPLCSRTGDVIELLIKPQWFIKSKGMAEKAAAAVKENKLIISPTRYCDNWFSWLENIQDWCISRQLWWGHQLPFYTCESNGRQTWFPAKSIKEAEEIARSTSSQPETLSRDPDVLDTWFSSALLPFSSFGWPKNTDDLKRYYPLNIMVTGNDILFFWVARMVMLSIELTNTLPFKEVFLHGIICDSQGRKMSKSLGNVIDPQDVIKGKSLVELTDRISNSFLTAEEIKKAKTELKRLYPQGIPACGVDALRFTLLSYNIKNHNVNFDVKECIVTKRFCNKIWQACNFTKKWLKKYPLAESSAEPLSISLMDKWINLKLNLMVAEVNEALTSRDFHIATNALKNFIHLELCDVYIEYVKPVFNRGNMEEIVPTVEMLRYVLQSSIKCLAPFMPFLAEHLNEMLLGTSHTLVMKSLMPSASPKEVDTSVDKTVTSALNTVYAIRKLKHNNGLNNQHIPVWISRPIKDNEVKIIVEVLAHCNLNEGVPEVNDGLWRKETLSEGVAVYLRTHDCIQKIDMDLPSIVKRKDKIKRELDKLEKMTLNKGYIKTPIEVQKAHAKKMFKLQTELKDLQSLAEETRLHKIHSSS